MEIEIKDPKKGIIFIYAVGIVFLLFGFTMTKKYSRREDRCTYLTTAVVSDMDHKTSRRGGGYLHYFAYEYNGKNTA